MSPGEPDAEAAPARVAALRAEVWMLAAILPAVADMSWVGSLAWSAALVIGAAAAGVGTTVIDGRRRESSATSTHPADVARFFRWVAVAWGAAAVVPGVSAPAIIAAGLLAGDRWPHVLTAAAVGPLAAVVVPGHLRTAAILLLGCAVAVILVGRRRDDL